MKVLPFKIPKAKNIGLIYQEDKGAAFYDKYHQHEEIQMSFIVRGEGTLIVGDTINEYKEGDVLIIGGNQPHVFKSDSTIVKDSFMVSLFFTEFSFGEDFFKLDDFKEIQDFFYKSKGSFKVVTNKGKLKKHFLKLIKSRDLDRFIVFIKVIDLALKSELVSLSSFIYSKRYTDNEGKRMRDIMDFTLTNYSNKIELDEVAGLANMTSNAFCRYFKQRTNKTYFSFLNELRIEKACKLLQNRDYLITEVSEKSGFKNISNFNRKFKELKGISPSKYRFDN